MDTHNAHVLKAAVTMVALGVLASQLTACGNSASPLIPDGNGSMVDGGSDPPGNTGCGDGNIQPYEFCPREFVGYGPIHIEGNWRADDALSIGDIDGDADPDIAAGGHLFRNNDGVLAETALPGGIAQLPTGGLLSLADVNGDGLADLLYAYTSASQVPTFHCSLTVSISTSTGFADPVSYDLTNPTAAAVEVHALAAGDLDQDGDTDLVIGIYSSGQGSYFVRLVNSGMGAFSSIGSTFTLSSDVTDLGIYDMNLDGSVDVLVVTGNPAPDGGAVKWQLGPSFSGGYAETHVLHTHPLDAVFIDADNDGKRELLLPDLDLDIVEMYLSQGAYATRNLSTGSATPSTGLALGDLDADGMLDLATAHEAVDEIRIQFAASPVPAVITMPEGARPLALRLADIDADGALDIIAFGNGATGIGLDVPPTLWVMSADP